MALIDNILVVASKRIEVVHEWNDTHVFKVALIKLNYGGRVLGYIKRIDGSKYVPDKCVRAQIE